MNLAQFPWRSIGHTAFISPSDYSEVRTAGIGTYPNIKHAKVHISLV